MKEHGANLLVLICADTIATNSIVLIITVTFADEGRKGAGKIDIIRQWYYAKVMLTWR